MKKEHYARLRDAIVRTHRPEIVETARDPQMRQRWDRLHAADLPRDWWNAVYTYATDDNIDTALRAIDREIT